MSRSKYKRKGAQKHVRLYEWLLRSPAWRALTPNERAAYIELKRRYDGFNNGRIGLGERELAMSLNIGRDTARRALRGLIEKGFVSIATPSGFNRKDRTATEWRLAEEKCDLSGALASKDFMKWRPEEKTTGAFSTRTGASQVHHVREKEAAHA